MKVFAKTEYACIAVLELSQRFDADEPVRIRDIADYHGVPARFLVQILLQLKGAGLVVSTRGAAGGYQLAKPPSEITLGEVMSAIEGDEPLASSAGANSATARVLMRAWTKVAAQERAALQAITFANLVEQLRGEADVMYYI